MTNVVDIFEFKRKNQKNFSNDIDKELDWITAKLDEVDTQMGLLEAQLIQAAEACKELMAYQTGIQLLKKKELANMETLDK
tara:strand:- start:271 stop:513 length:243 start_codon:yes stop_codon:yes gene_type:complete